MYEMCIKFAYIYVFFNTKIWGQVAVLVRSHMNGLIPFERTIKTNNRNNALSPKTVTAATLC